MQAPASASDFKGPGRFCGYSPIIDLIEGESIQTVTGGFHGGRFRWTGAFGELEVYGNGWAAPPSGWQRSRKTAKGQTIFAERRIDRRYVIAIWNGRQGAAYFYSANRLTKAQREAIERVDLFQEDEEPNGCSFRTLVVWE